jgi:hypothetical protein
MKTILCLPGLWEDRSAFLAASIKAGLPAAGLFIVDTLSKTHVEFEFHERDGRMRRAFSGSELPQEELDAIGEHKSVVYLLGEGGDLEKLRALVSIAVRLLPVGALGIKVESAGIGAPIDTWMRLSHTLDPFGLIRCFVVVASGEGHTYSCGMHNLGFPDVICDAPPELVKDVIDRFNLYQLVERPVLKDGQTFAVAEGAPLFTMHKEPCTLWPDHDPYFNPFGMWRLRLASIRTRGS